MNWLDSLVKLWRHACETQTQQGDTSADSHGRNCLSFSLTALLFHFRGSHRWHAGVQGRNRGTGEGIGGWSACTTWFPLRLRINSTTCSLIALMTKPKSTYRDEVINLWVEVRVRVRVGQG